MYDREKNLFFPLHFIDLENKLKVNEDGDEGENDDEEDWDWCQQPPSQVSIHLLLCLLFSLPQWVSFVILLVC